MLNFYVNKSKVSWSLIWLQREMFLLREQFSICVGTPQLLGCSTSQLLPVPALLALLGPSPGVLRLYVLLLQSLRAASDIGPVPASQDNGGRGRRKQ